MPMQYKPVAEAKGVKPPVLESPGNNSFLGDVLVADAPKGEQMASGFYRQEKGEPLVYHYTYDEMKIIVEVVGEFFISDETGKKVSVSPGDVLYFKKGTTITFESTDHALAYYVGLRDPM